MTTFPGGVFERSDTDLRMTAIRETFEETGVLLGTSKKLTTAQETKQWRDTGI